jgi:hypothetical protein
MSMIFERYPGGGGEYALALSLADHSHDDGTHIFPSVDALARKSRQSRRTVQYQLKKMRDDNWLICTHDGGGGPKDTREYHINPDWIAGAEYESLKIKGAIAVAPLAEIKGATAIAPLADKKGCNLEQEGCNLEQIRVQSGTNKGAIAVAPESSTNHKLTIKEPIRARLTELGLPDDLAETWLGIQLEKQLDLTLPDLEAILAESKKAHLTFEQAINFCCDSGWAKFRAKWYFDELQKLKTGLAEKNPQQVVVSVEERRRRIRQTAEQLKAMQQNEAAHPTG